MWLVATMWDGTNLEDGSDPNYASIQLSRLVPAEASMDSG